MADKNIISFPNSNSFHHEKRGRNKSNNFIQKGCFIVKKMKNLPQTSNSLMKASGKISPLVSEKEKVIHKTEDDFQAKLSPPLSKLLSKVSKLYKDCEIIPDNSYPEHGLYSYLFDKHCKRVDKFCDIKEKPEFLFISCRFNLPDLIFPNESNSKTEFVDDKSISYINLYSTIINDDKAKTNVKSCIQRAKSPAYKIKHANRIKNHKNLEIQECPQQEAAHIFPFASGKKVREGNAGFRKVNNLFDKRKYSLSPTPCYERSIDTGNKSSMMSTRVMPKEINLYNDICMKYSLTKQEFLKISADFNYIKDNYKANWSEIISGIYKISQCVLHAVIGQTTSELTMEEFLRFHIIVLYKRASFIELCEFIRNIWLLDSRCEYILCVSCSAGRNASLEEKVKSLVKIIKNSLSDLNELISKMQEAGTSIYDLRLIVTLIIKSLK